MLNRLPLVILVFLGATVVFILVGDGGITGFPREVNACNAETTKNVIITNMVTNVKDGTSSKELSAAPIGSPAHDIIQGLRSWTATVDQIRQVRYDEKNDARYCQAVIVHRNLPAASLMAMQILGTKVNVCLERINYKIQKLANGKDEYVSWTCED